MREILADAARWASEERAFAMATVVGVDGSAPREVGASMIVAAGGQVLGTVSGGCVEGAVYERCLEVLAGAAPGVERFSYSDVDALAVGLTCGGTIDILVRAVRPGSRAAADLQLLAAREQAGIPTRYTLATGGAAIGDGVIDSADAGGAAATVTLEVGAPTRLVIVGAVEFAVALARLGSAMGMRVTVVDPREVFAASARFPGAEVVVDWPDRYLAGATLDAQTAVCVLTHDPKLDVPAIRSALAASVGYLGAMGSRRTVADRRRRLIEAGVSEAALARLRSPIGLDLGGRSPEATALSILAEILADRHGGSGARLSHLAGPVHAARPRTDRDARADVDALDTADPRARADGVVADALDAVDPGIPSPDCSWASDVAAVTDAHAAASTAEAAVGHAHAAASAAIAAPADPRS
ncbi:MAG: XshC-Cox1-family protein [Microbacterium sp.]|nr:MAG: XshC-Cox1-family protein [Microbacterium sp.]